MIFHGVVRCESIQGLLFSCLRALFLLSVMAILVCIFSLMLVYQLLSHQKKKKYLQQLEVRRRFHVQSRVFGSHSSHPSYVSTHVSPHILAQNRNNSLRRLGFGYCDDIIANGWTLPPHSYDNLDSRLYNRNFEDDIQSSNEVTANLSPNRSHSWINWLNWSRNQVSNSNQLIPNQSSNRRFFNFFRRNSNNSGDNHNCWRPPTHSYLPPHVFIPRIGSGGLIELPPHLTRYRDNHMRRSNLTPINNSYRRTRSNDGIFQHMNGPNIPIEQSFQSSFNPNPNISTNVFALWGPPPPYTCSQPQSLNRINTICNNISHSSIGQNCRESSVVSTDVTPTSKLSTPLSERRLRCNAFSSEGIRLNIEGNDSLLKRESKGSCIVEIHVPYNRDPQNNSSIDLMDSKDSNKKTKLSFNTMPSMKRSEDHSLDSQPMIPFKSLSNIAITFPNDFNYENETELSDSELESNKSKVETIKSVFSSHEFQKSSLSSSTLNSTSNTTSEMTSDFSTFGNTEVSFSADSFPVDPPTDYKSTLIIQTLDTQSSPLTDKTSDNLAERQRINGEKDIRLISAQSMPNLSCIIPVSSSQSTSTRTQPNVWELHRIPSSGNTSTSQDLADYELELDEESIKFMADLPNDGQTKQNSDSFDSSKSSSETASITPELIKPPTPFKNQDYMDNNTTSTATLSSLSDPKPDLIIKIRGIPV